MSLSNEERGKLQEVRPPTVMTIFVSLVKKLLPATFLGIILQIGAASRISGVTPSAILAILQYLNRRKRSAVTNS